MRFHRGWIEPVLTVPYIPTLGPVHRDDPLFDLMEAVVANATTGQVLPYDKDGRWSDSKSEWVVVDGIEHGPARTLVPTFLERGPGTVKVHVYGGGDDGLSAGADLARKLAASLGAGAARVVSFLGPDQPEELVWDGAVRVQLKELSGGSGQAPGGLVWDYKEIDEPEAFGVFAERMTADGFGFLYERMRAGTSGPVLVVLDEGRLAGAIGPMEVMSDASARPRLLPQYFGVLPEYRGFGYGRTLWRAAMNWGHQHGAEYQLLQTVVGGPSDRLCQSEGLSSLGFVLKKDA
ncbi:GNAT family N-acetyltransferase [Streptomyces sp. NPDC058398]|uniref:GNAT family N-acetyltransferase n=1 Tax=Streptomyces sp. NPDC058398 TaxID=3346479 RepID=UPI00365D8C76